MICFPKLTQNKGISKNTLHLSAQMTNILQKNIISIKKQKTIE